MIYIGTSGWLFGDWKGVFYPEKISKKDWLKYYSTKLNSVEINNTFYKIPEVSNIINWKNSVPDHFKFSVKMFGYITHTKKLKKDTKPIIDRFLESISHLDNKLAMILIQLPPKFNYNEEKLFTFIDLLPQEFNYVFEFRNDSWYNNEVKKLFKSKNISICISDRNEKNININHFTSDNIYFRLHEPKDKYKGSYSKKFLNNLNIILKQLDSKHLNVFCYFDNDEKGFAIQNALYLQQMIEKD